MTTTQPESEWRLPVQAARRLAQGVSRSAATKFLYAEGIAASAERIARAWKLIDDAVR